MNDTFEVGKHYLLNPAFGRPLIVKIIEVQDGKFKVAVYQPEPGIFNGGYLVPAQRRYYTQLSDDESAIYRMSW